MSTRAQVACFYIAVVALVCLGIGYGVRTWVDHAIASVTIGGTR